MIYNNGFMTKYLVAVHTSVQALLGGDISPSDSIQTAIATLGIFLGAIINANIFGELAVILASMGKTEKQFASFFSASNTAMINLELPLNVQQNVRDLHIRNQSSRQSQKEMLEFLSVISPSIKFRILCF